MRGPWSTLAQTMTYATPLPRTRSTWELVQGCTLTHTLSVPVTTAPILLVSNNLLMLSPPSPHSSSLYIGHPSRRAAG